MEQQPCLLEKLWPALSRTSYVCFASFPASLSSFPLARYPEVTLSDVALVVKELPANAGDTRDSGSVPGLGRSLDKERATHSSILAWEIPWTKEPGGPQSIWSQITGHD